MRPRCLALAAVVAVAGCDGIPGQPPAASQGASPAASPVEDRRVAQARARLKVAEGEPLPTPPPPPSPRPRNWTPEPAPDFKPGEIEAIGLLEEAAAADPRRPEAHTLLARLLEPAALRRHAAAAAARPRRAKGPVPSPSPEAVDASPGRVARAYRAAIETTAGAEGAALIEKAIAFATTVGDLETADWAYQERIRRAKENASAGPLEAYGDFLLDVRRDPVAAAEQYRNVLIWNADNARVRERLAGIHLRFAGEHLAKREFAAAEARVTEAAKYVDEGTPHAATLAEYRRELSAIRR